MGMDFFVMRVGSFGTYQRRIFVLLCLAAIPAGIKNTGPAFWANPSLPLCAPSREDADDITVNGTARQSSDLPPHDSHPSSTPNSSGINSTIATSIEINTLVYNRRTSQDVANQPMVLSSLLHQKCFISENETSWLVTNNGTTQQCRKSEAAFSTIVGRWSLVCQNKWWLGLLHHMYVFGQIIGCLAAGLMSDRFGRRVTIVVCTAVQIPVSVLAAVVPDRVAFAVLRTVLAAATAGQFNTAFILVVELLGPAWRVFGGTVFFCFLPVGNLILAGAAYHFKNYVGLKLVTSIPLSFLLIYIWVLPESVRWMYSRGQMEEVRGQLKYITEINHVEGADDVAERQLENDENVRVPVDLAAKPWLRKKVAVLSYIWWICVTVLSTVNYELLVRMSDRPLAVSMGAALDFGAFTLAMLCLYKVGRRLPLTVALIITGLALQCTAPAPLRLRSVHTVLLVVARVFCTLSVALLRIYAAELLPTALRGTALGLITAVAHTGANIMPFILSLSSVQVDLPHIVEGGLCILAALCVLFVPTTFNQSLPDTIKESEQMGNNQRMLVFVVEERASSAKSRVLRPKSHSVAATTPRAPSRPRFSLPDGKLRLTVPDGAIRGREKRRSWHTLLPEAEGPREVELQEAGDSSALQGPGRGKQSKMSASCSSLS